MSNVEVVLNVSGIIEMLKSQEMKAILAEHANSALGRLGDGYKSKSFDYPERSAVVISADTAKAKKENSENNTILKAIGG